MSRSERRPTEAEIDAYEQRRREALDRYAAAFANWKRPPECPSVSMPERFKSPARGESHKEARK